MASDFGRQRGEIERTAERYAGHRWLNWVPFAMFPLGIGWVMLVAWLTRVGLGLAGASWESGRGHALYLWIWFPVAFAGLLVLIGLFAWWYEGWRDRRLAVKTKAMARPQSWKQLLVSSFLIGVFVALSHRLGALPLRLQPLAFVLSCALMGLLVVWVARVPLPKRPAWRWLWEESPVGTTTLIACAAYALAVAAGLPQPLVRALPGLGTLQAAILPLALIWLVSIVAGEIYARTQLRRLQRLLRNTAPGGTDGTD